MVGFDMGRVAAVVNMLWDRWAGVALAVAVVTLLLLAVTVVRHWRRRDFTAKASLGFGVVQVGVTYAVVLGVYEFFGPHVLDLPKVEAAVLAVFVEAVVWAAVGFIAAYAKRGGVGFGPAGPFFWTAVLGGGTLAVLGSENFEVAIGRTVIVTLGAYMWYLRLLQIIIRPPRPRVAWAWTPARLLVALGAMEPRTDDAAVEHDAAREHQVRRLARAIRWANSGRPWRWLGMRTLARRAETVAEDVIGEARRRWAVAHVLREQSRADSPTMAALVAEVEQAVTAATARPAPDLRADMTAPGRADIAPDVPPDMSPPAPPARPRRKSGRTRGGEAGTVADRVAELLAQHPDMTRAELAKQVGTSTRHVRRVLADVSARGTEPDPDTSATGKADLGSGQVRTDPADPGADMSARTNGHPAT